MPELTPEERERIYQEEKVRHEARQKLEKQEKDKKVATLEPDPGGTATARVFGVLLLIGGLGGLLYFGAVFNTSVPTNIPPGTEALGIQFPDHVNNMGLLADRQNGMIGSGVAAILGAILLATSKLRQ